METRYERFARTRQDKLRLSLALEGALHPLEDEDAAQQEEYLAYLKKRIRPACHLLAGEARQADLFRLRQLGLLTDEIQSELLLTTAGEENPAGWMTLLAVKTRPDDMRDRMQAEEQEPAVYGITGKHLAGKLRREPERRIMREAARSLYLSLPYLSAAIGALPVRFAADEASGSFVYHSSENVFLMDPDACLQLYERDPRRLRRGYLHVLLHLLFEHPWQNRDPLACDIAVEFQIEREIRKNKTLRDLFGELPSPGLWSSLYDQMTDGIWSPGRIEDWLSHRHLPEEKRRTWERVFSFDSASCTKNDRMRANETQGFWHGIRLRTQLSLAEEEMDTQDTASGSGVRGSGESGGRGIHGGFGIGSEAGEIENLLSGIQKSPRDYRSFLQRFATWGEEQELDTASFDYLFYTLGMQRYGNLPLIEPLEYREGHRVRDLIIAIDTSGSCDDATVRRFLEETRAILEEKEAFFRQMNVYLIQCDCAVQSVAHLKSREDWEAYLRTLKIQGRAGTDFRPVFRYVQKLLDRGELAKVAGLIYFTDGDGVYPRENPGYETAFVFSKETASARLAPRFIQRYVL